MKFLSGWTDDFEPPEWPAFRMREKRCIHREIRSTENGDALFPQYYGSRKGSWLDSARTYYSKKEIRDGYFGEISNILNGIVRLWYMDYQDTFINEYYRIKSGKNKESTNYYNWLNNEEIKEIIKKWDGNPLDVLIYLSHSGLIEKAVRLEAKKWQRK
jgi:hypothetical protein